MATKAKSAPNPIPECQIPIIQQRLQNEKIKSEINSKKKWNTHQKAKIELQLKEMDEMYGKARHPIDVRLNAAANGRGFLPTSLPHRSEPDSSTYYGYGIAPPGPLDEQLQIARGTYDGHFVKSAYANHERSKFGKLTSEKRWMDYSGAIIFGKAHLDPLANDFRKFRSTPRALRNKTLDEEFFKDESDEDDYSPRSVKSTHSTKSIRSTQSTQSLQSRPSTSHGLHRNRGKPIVKGPFISKYRDYTFSFSPLTCKPKKPSKAPTPENKVSEPNHRGGDVQHPVHDTLRTQSSTGFSLGSSIKVGGRWKIPKQPNRPTTALAKTSNGKDNLEVQPSSSRSQRLEHLLELRKNRLATK